MSGGAAAGAFIAAFGGGILTTFAVRSLARRLAIVSPPNPILVQHAVPVAYMGGVSVFLAVPLAALLWAVAGGAPSLHAAAGVLTWPQVAVPALAFLLLGLVDDLHVLSVRRKFLLQVLVAAGAVALGLRWAAFPHGPLNAALSALWVVTLVNAFNFVDVADGQAAGLSAVVFCAASALHPELMSAGALLAGACAGFLVFNFPPATIFLGDAGSHLLGFTAAALSLAAPSAPGPAVATWTLLLGVFLFELVFVSWVRIRKGIPPWRGSPDHFSLRLRAAGLGRRSAAVAAWTVAAVLAAMAAAYSRLETSGRAMLLLAALGAAFATARWLLRHEVRARQLSDHLSPVRAVVDGFSPGS